jgi:trehalose utilization protein
MKPYRTDTNLCGISYRRGRCAIAVVSPCHPTADRPHRGVWCQRVLVGAVWCCAPGVHLGMTKAPPSGASECSELVFYLVETRGIEPLTSTLQR